MLTGLLSVASVTCCDRLGRGRMVDESTDPRPMNAPWQNLWVCSQVDSLMAVQGSLLIKMIQNGPKKQIHGRYGATGRLFALLFAYYLLTIGSCCITCAESPVQLRSMGNPRWKWKLSLACSTFGSSYILYIYIYILASQSLEQLYWVLLWVLISDWNEALMDLSKVKAKIQISAGAAKSLLPGFAPLSPPRSWRKSSTIMQFSDYRLFAHRRKWKQEWNNWKWPLQHLHFISET